MRDRVGEAAEVADPLGDRRVVDGHRHGADGEPRAHAADQDLRLEGEAVGAAAERERLRERIDAEARLRVFERPAAGDLHPAVRVAVAERADRGDGARLRLARPDHQRARLGRRRGEQGRDLVAEVLPVAVEREHVRDAVRAQGLHAEAQCRALAAVRRLAQHVGAGRLRGIGGAVARAVVHDEDPRHMPAGAGHDGLDGGLAVEGGDQRSELGHGGQPCPGRSSCQTRPPMLDGVWLRKLAYLGSAYAPEWFKRSSPHLIAALTFALHKERRLAHRGGIGRKDAAVVIGHTERAHVVEIGLHDRVGRRTKHGKLLAPAKCILHQIVSRSRCRWPSSSVRPIEAARSDHRRSNSHASGKPSSSQIRPNP